MVIILLLALHFPLIFPLNHFQLSLNNFKIILFVVCVMWFTMFVYLGVRGKEKGWHIRKPVGVKDRPKVT